MQSSPGKSSECAPDPTDAPSAVVQTSFRLKSLPPPAKLLIPCRGVRDDDLGLMKPIGLFVSRGESLFDDAIDAVTVPRAPVDGKIVGQELAPITRDVFVPSVRFEPSSKEIEQS